MDLSKEEKKRYSKLERRYTHVERLLGGTWREGLTFNITPDIGLRSLILVDQLDDAQKILLLKLLQGLGDLFVVILLGSLLAHETFLLGSVFVRGQRARLAKPLLKCLRRVFKHNRVCHLILFLLEVEVVDDGSQLGLFGSVEIDANLKLTPTLVGANEGGLGEG